MRRKFRYMIHLAVGCLLTACSNDLLAPNEGASSDVSARVVSTSSASAWLADTSLAVGDTTSVVLNTAMSVQKARTKSTVRYATRDSTVATVSSSGVVTGRGDGTTTIVVRLVTGATQAIRVRVTAPVVAAPDSAAIPIGGPQSAPAPMPPVDASPSVPPAAPVPPTVSGPPGVTVPPTVPTPPGLVPPPTVPAPPAPPVVAPPAAQDAVFRDTVSVLPTQATLPQRFVRFTAPTSTRTVFLRQGANLQAALDTARRGDEIVLARGATFNGGFVLRRKADTQGWIVIRGETDPAPLGDRPTPSQFATAPKIVTTTNGVPALDAEGGTSGYWIKGIEFATTAAVTQMGALVSISPAQGVASDVPSRIMLERTYVHGHDGLNMQRCVHFDASNSAVTDSWISDCHYRGLESQAILVLTSPGPLLFRNNHLAGAAENIMIGGGSPSVANMLPEDIEIVGNHLYKPLSWQAAGWTVKNSLEIKFGRRIDIRDNFIENNWVMGQVGFAIVLKAANQDEAPWVRTTDITFRRNIVSGSAGGINIFEDGAVGTSRIAILSNEFLKMGLNSLGGMGRMIQLVGRLSDIEVRHNTMLFAQSGSVANSAIMMDGTGSQRVNIINNIFQGGEYGFIRSGGASGINAVLQYSPDARVVGNAIAVGWNAGYGTANTVVSSVAGLGFADPGATELRLLSSSGIRHSGALGATPGVPAGALASAVAARVLQ